MRSPSLAKHSLGLDAHTRDAIDDDKGTVSHTFPSLPFKLLFLITEISHIIEWIRIGVMSS